MRGICFFIQKCKEQYGPSIHIVIASGGNAGLAAACAANVLDLRCTVYIPEGASQTTIALLEREGAEVVVEGKAYIHAFQRATEVIKAKENAILVPPYDDTVVWQGHASMIREFQEQLPTKPDSIFCSVGGGGLLGGIIVGCKEADWDDVPVIALETNGSNCFYYSMSINRDKSSAASDLPDGIDIIHDAENDVMLAYLNHLTSRASGSLGASSPAPAVVKMALQRVGGVRCVSVPDELSMQTAECFADEHKFLVELACSTTLTPAYKPALFSRLMSSIPAVDGKQKEKTVVFIVCGGFKISLEEMAEYHQLVKTDLKQGIGRWEVMCDGEQWFVDK